jgi:hypothetical protein
MGTSGGAPQRDRLPCGCDVSELARSMGISKQALLRAAARSEQQDDGGADDGEADGGEPGPFLLTLPLSSRRFVQRPSSEKRPSQSVSPPGRRRRQ